MTTWSVAGALRLPGRLVGAMVSRAVPAFGVRQAGWRTWRDDHRVLVKVPGLGEPESAALGRRLEEELGALSGVAWVAVNAVLERVVIGLADPPTGMDALDERIGKMVAAHRRAVGEAAEGPDEDGPLVRAVTALAADAAGLVVATIGRMAGRVPGAVEVAALLAAVDTQPRL